MGRYNALTHEERKIIKKRLDEGKTYKEIGDELGRYFKTISNDIMRWGGFEKYDPDQIAELLNAMPPWHIKKRRDLNEEEISILKQMAKDGYSMRQISHKLGIHTSVLHRWKSQLGLVFEGSRSWLQVFKRLEALEGQIELIHELLEEINNGNQKNK